MPVSCDLAGVIFRPVKASTIRYLVDAGPLIGLLDADDQWHRWSAATLTVLDEPLATTETVVAEACHRLARLRPALRVIPRLVAEGPLELVPAFAGKPERVEELLCKYPTMDAADATLVVLSELLPDARLITIDGDFRHYRRFRSQAVPLVIPEFR